MRSTSVLGALALTLVALPAGAGTGPERKDLDKKVLDLVKRATDLYKNAKLLHVEADMVTHVEEGGRKREIKSTAVYDLEKPNLFSLKTRLDGDANAGPDVVCDGKKLFVHAKRLKQYTETDAPEDLAGVGRVLPKFGHVSTGMLFQNVLTEDPYDTLIDGVTACSYGGKVKVNGAEAHHLTFAQPDMKWELWVAAGGQPLVLKAASTRALEKGAITTVETYKDWKVDAAPAKSLFSFTAPAGVKKVKLFRQGR
jgi:hypothetical protein